MLPVGGSCAPGPHLQEDRLASEQVEIEGEGPGDGFEIAVSGEQAMARARGGDRDGQVDQVGLPPLARESVSSGATGRRGGVVVLGRAGGVSQPFRTASAS